MKEPEHKHEYEEHYYGWKCRHCGHFVADGQEPWAPDDLAEEEPLGAWDIPDFDDEEEWESDFDCGFVPGMGCQKIGSEQCDFECPYREEYYATLKR